MKAQPKFSILLMSAAILFIPTRCFGSMFIDCLYEAKVIKIYSDTGSNQNNLKLRVQIINGRNSGFLSYERCSSTPNDTAQDSQSVVDTQADMTTFSDATETKLAQTPKHKTTKQKPTTSTPNKASQARQMKSKSIPSPQDVNPEKLPGAESLPMVLAPPA